jgi:hypothetical protein
MEWVIEDLTKSELQQCLMNVVLRIQKAPLQGFSSAPAESVLAIFCNVKVDSSGCPGRQNIDRLIPGRTTVEVRSLPAGAHVEITATTLAGSEG